MTEQTDLPSDLWSTLSDRLSERRRERMLQVVRGRTYQLRLVIQDVHDHHNVAACLRSAEAFGVQSCDVVIQEGTKGLTGGGRSRYKPSTAARGTENWLTVRSFPSIESCANRLREQGFRLAAAMPQNKSLPLSEVPISAPLAVIFGNERSGLDANWEKHIDYAFHIPMYGMVESLNISVSAAITLHELTSRLKSSRDNWALNSFEENQLLGYWLTRQVDSWKAEYERRQVPKAQR